MRQWVRNAAPSRAPGVRSSPGGSTCPGPTGIPGAAEPELGEAGNEWGPAGWGLRAAGWLCPPSGPERASLGPARCDRAQRSLSKERVRRGAGGREEHDIAEMVSPKYHWCGGRKSTVDKRSRWQLFGKAQ